MAFAGCAAKAAAPTSTSTSAAPGTSSTQPPASSTTTTTSPTTTTTTTTTTVPPPGFLSLGSKGPEVLALQQRLVALGYWLGTPDGTFGDATQQAVWAFQKAAGLGRDGVVGPLTKAALARGIEPTPQPATGYIIEVDLETQLLMIVDNGKLLDTLNTSTGGGYDYVDKKVTYKAITPTGHFKIFWTINGLDVDSLGALWRPRFFDGGFAIHGDSYVPPYPVSHGCVRVSDEAIDWIWANNIAPIGTAVWVF